MPLLRITALNEYTHLLVWKITETFDELFTSVALRDVSLARLESMKAESHQKGFLGVRRLLMEVGYTDYDLYYDNFGKPHLKDGKHISISHSNDFSVIVLSEENIGADLEILKEKTLKLAPRFMDVSHLQNLNIEEQLKKATVVWGIKESVFKIKNEVGISFKDHIFENDFTLSDKKCSVELRFNNKIECFDILFDFIEDYVFVCAFEKK
ncbi:4-phosphopantetheinyl transferase [Flavobacterium silvisoli]|uniref:4-phosphopantetheinyl transferase n=1 Tax=Flavobacterium silvisoli TaxID=2529433 RepID=A0A4Q9Z9X4_9FLAO|nr:4-phosphopantetheinyl transferase [Flavobacterium silvisoli]TBX70999.1 4-phosphopantetheinyl transferase [Flavobacterium silvisoli]